MINPQAPPDSQRVPCCPISPCQSAVKGQVIPVITFPDIERIVLDPAIMGGKPCIRGTRVTVGTITGLLASGADVQEILQLYPYLAAEDIRAALGYATWRSEEQEIPWLVQ